MGLGVGRRPREMGRAVADYEDRAMRGVDESGRYASEQEPTPPGEAPGADDDEVLRVTVEVVEKRFQNLSPQGHGFDDPDPSSASVLSKLVQQRGEGTPVVGQGDQRFEAAVILPPRRGKDHRDRQDRPEAAGHLRGHLNCPSRGGRAIKPDQDPFEHFRSGLLTSRALATPRPTRTLARQPTDLRWFLEHNLYTYCASLC